MNLVHEWSWRGCLDPQERERRLHRLFPPHRLTASALLRTIRRLDSMYRLFATTAPIPPWAPGLVATPEMHRQAELYLPLSTIAGAFRAAFHEALAPPPAGTALTTAASWYAFQQALSLADCPANPAEVLRMFAESYPFRIRFLFALFVPRHFGGSFGRYPRQARHAIDFLRGVASRPLRCLDAACGTGEQTWEISSSAASEGMTAIIEGTSLNAAEVFAAAHGFFPNDPGRESRHIEQMKAALAASGPPPLFRVDDLLDGRQHPEEEYDLILCNGFLGGPFLHDRRQLAASVALLTQQLRPGGRLMAADTFHFGWKKIITTETIAGIFEENGLRLVEGGEGVAGEKVAGECRADIVKGRGTS